MDEKMQNRKQWKRWLVEKDAGAPSTVGQIMGVAKPPNSGRRAGSVGEQRQDDAEEGHTDCPQHSYTLRWARLP